MYIACQFREGNLKDLFKHENQPWPPALSKGVTLRSANKADLLVELEALVRPVAANPQVTAKILDGAVIVQMLSPRNSQTFEDYSKTVFMPYIGQQLEHTDRIGIVWDVYTQASLEAATRESSGNGVRRRVELSSKMPSNWNSFLRVNENKTELFHLLAEEATCRDLPQKQVFSTYGDKVLSAPRYIVAHTIVATLGPTKAPALTVFHAFTENDTTSFFAGIGKRTA